MLLLLVVSTAALLPAAQSLKCYHDATVSSAVYDGLVRVSDSSSSFETGFLTCASNLDRCVNFMRMDISVFKTLDAAKDGNPDYIKKIISNNWKVSGRACMSAADCGKIKATLEDKCDTELDHSCSCTADECTGSAGSVLSFISLLAVLLCYFKE
ncbi:hypothetical protein PFISCL1PPCAC_4166 [Pristionchus fissidentatus]|uniref:Uncharacterized protein n=1 Tax=Pristionchus fissidentatus TaxID=1538716 RepID=A0AAV5V2T0_9BILA|nr:hypothetical protein PFISCL1PPCAC_4166 [Pristionchus fissidentatus]